MVALNSNRKLVLSDGEKVRKKSLRLANALAIELLHYGILVDQEIIDRIARHKRVAATAICVDILKMFTIGELNPPLFQQWEQRTDFTFDEFVVQILGYVFQFSGNDLQDAAFMPELKRKVDYRKLKRLEIAPDDAMRSRFQDLVSSRVSLEKNSQAALVELARVFHDQVSDFIASDEARIAVLLGKVEAGVKLGVALEQLRCRPLDVLRFSAAQLNFSGVKLPADVRFASLSWSNRVELFTFLNGFSLESLCEAMGNNRRAWIRFFQHTHLLQQKGSFRNRLRLVIAAAYISTGAKLESVPDGKMRRFVSSQSAFFDITEGGNMAYRTFASRVQKSVDEQDFAAFAKEIDGKPNYLFRNIGAFSHVCTKKTEGDFVALVRGMIEHASISVLLSIVQIDPEAEFRIIDSKGNTTVKPASYSPVLSEIQRAAEREIYRRHGFDGKVVAVPSVAHRVVPFLATNAELDRGSKVAFDDTRYLFFLIHWIQNEKRTDLDHSFVCLDANWEAETIYFGNQANAYISQSGDITNAPAPHGGTEYGRIRLDRIPPHVKYIVPLVNVYCGDVFSENQTAYAGFMFSNEPKFSLRRKHVRYDLCQPANSNIPFVIDVSNRELIIVDFNNRQRNGLTAHSSIGEIRKIISALKTKKFMTIERFAALLSGDEDRIALTIQPVAKNKLQLEPAEMQSLVS